MTEWQPLHDWKTLTVTRALFYIVPKTEDETYLDSNGRSILSKAAPRIEICSPGGWSSLSKATHWMLLPEPPTQKGSQT